MDVVRDLLDKVAVDRSDREIGRVDRVVLDVPVDGPPRLAGLEIGAPALAARLHPRLGRVVAAIERALHPQRPGPMTLPMGRVRTFAQQITIDVAFDDTPAAEREARLRRWLPPWRGGNP
jgi:hypothetical protein